MNRNIHHKQNYLTTAARAVLLAALIIGAYPTRSRADVVLWTGGSMNSSDWSDSANWLAGNAPGNGDDVVFGLNFRTTNFDNFFSLNINTLQFSTPAPAFTLHIIKTSALTISGAGVLNNSANIQTLINRNNSQEGADVGGTHDLSEQRERGQPSHN